MNPLIKLFREKIYTAVFLLALIVLIGVLGFRFMSDYSWVDALYMTVITITTVGFEEVHPLDDNAKIFTIFLILTSVVILGYAISVITEYILSKNNYEELKQKKMQKKIDGFKKPHNNLWLWPKRKAGCKKAHSLQKTICNY